MKMVVQKIFFQLCHSVSCEPDNPFYESYNSVSCCDPGVLKSNLSNSILNFLNSFSELSLEKLLLLSEKLGTSTENISSF